MVFVINRLVNKLLSVIGVDPLNRGNGDKLNSEELRTVVNEAGDMIPERHQKMLINILDLEKATVDEIMVPRSDI